MKHNLKLISPRDLFSNWTSSPFGCFFQMNLHNICEDTTTDDDDEEEEEEYNDNQDSNLKRDIGSTKIQEISKIYKNATSHIH